MACSNTIWNRMSPEDKEQFIESQIRESPGRNMTCTARDAGLYCGLIQRVVNRLEKQGVIKTYYQRMSVGRRSCRIRRLYPSNSTARKPDPNTVVSPTAAKSACSVIWYKMDRELKNRAVLHELEGHRGLSAICLGKRLTIDPMIAHEACKILMREKRVIKNRNGTYRLNTSVKDRRVPSKAQRVRKPAAAKVSSEANIWAAPRGRRVYA